MKTKYSLLLALLLISSFSGASDICLDQKLESVPIQTDGRVMPLFVHAKSVKKKLFGKKQCNSLSATALYCYLAQGKLTTIVGQDGCDLTFKVPHEKLKLFLGAAMGKISVVKAREMQPEILAEYQTFQGDADQTSSYARSLIDILNRLFLVAQIEMGEDWKYIGSDRKWHNISSIITAKGFNEIILNSVSFLDSTQKKRLNYEVIYEKTMPATFSLIFCILGFIFSLLWLKSDSKWITRITAALFTSIVLVEIYLFTMRALVSGRSPIANMYETVMLTGLGGLVLGAIIVYNFKLKQLLPLGFVINLICLFMMRFATTMLDGKIKPLVPVLRDNFWLSTHVSTVTLSYACFALACLVGNYLLIMDVFSKDQRNKLELWNKAIRIIIQIGVVFLATGIILGGIWADYSWGRFWGWDPKETWSLISLIVYIIILHGRYVGWFKGIVFTMISTIGFLFILMTWFGVNYILSAGLHSYGSSEGGTVFMIVTFAVEIVIVGFSAISYQLQTKRSK